MNQLQIINYNGKFVADSREVAEMVGKEHPHLLRDIRNYAEILGKSNFGLANFFIESFYADGQGKPRPHYFLTKKGCDMVANKMTGVKGVLFTAEYVTKFEEMEKQTKQGFNLPTNYKEALLQLVSEVEKNERIESKNKMLEQRVAEYEPKVSYVDEILSSKGTVTITQIAKDYGLTGQELNKILHQEKIQYKLNGQWLLYREHQGKGYTKSKTNDFSHSDGRKGVRMDTRWRQKGRLFIHEILKTKEIVPVLEQEEELMHV